MADIDYGRMGEEVAKALRRGNSGPNFGGGAPAGSSGGAGGSVDQIKSEAGNAATAVKGFVKAAGDSMDTFQKLSSTGSNFSNDLVGMNVAAAKSRLDLNNFADVVATNGKYLSGLGGSVTRGTEAFAKLSDGFFKSNMDKDLRNLGYTSKDLNEVLALQASIQRTSNTEDEKSASDTRNSAAAMAKEMDLMAKLTGKTRQEQMEMMQKNRADGQVEAKLRLMTMGKTEDEARQIRTQAMAALQQAEIEGRGQMAKELFATGTLMSDEAQSQFATFGKASQATADQMSALGKGQFEAAKQFGDRATSEMLRNQQDPTLLLQATLGEAGGPIGKTMMKNIETMGPFNDSVQATAKSMGVLLTTQDGYAKALKAARDEVERARAGYDKTGQRVGGTVAAGASIEKGLADVRAGVAGLATVRNPQGQSLSTEAARAGEITAEGVRNLQGYKGNIGATIEGRGQEGLASGGKEGGAIGVATNAALNIAKGTITIAGETVLNITGKVNSMSGRSTGSLGMTGKLIEDFGSGTMAMLHGKEGVITEDQLKKLVSGVQDTGISSVVSKFAEAQNSIKSMDIGDLPGAKVSDAAGATAQNPMDNFASMAKDVTGMLPKGMPAMDLNAINLPGFGANLKAATSSTASAVKPPPAATAAAAQSSAQQTAATQAASSQPPSPKSTQAGNDASLNDVVRTIESLNKLMGQLLAQNDDLGRKQISATRSNSTNVYERN